MVHAMTHAPAHSHSLTLSLSLVITGCRLHPRPIPTAARFPDASAPRMCVDGSPGCWDFDNPSGSSSWGGQKPPEASLVS